MTLKITRVDAGEYSTEIHDRPVEIWKSSMDQSWVAFWSGETAPAIARGRSKREVVSRLEILARQPQDREVSETLKLFRRSKIEKHTQLTVEGIPGKCSFISYTRKDDGSEWIDVITSKLQSRTVRPDRIKTVHRKKARS